MKFNEIRTFVAVADARSVQEAADRLRLTQSAVSRLIQRLEGELGVVLFDRQTKPLALTNDGRLALDHARRVMKASEAMAAAFAEGGEPNGLFRLGSSHVLARLAAGEPLDALRRRFPKVTLRLHTDWSGALLEQLNAGTLDGALIILYATGHPSGDFEAECLAVEEVRAVATPELAAATPPSLEALNRVGWVLQPDGCGYRTALERILARSGATLNVAVESYDQELLLSLAARGVGFGLAPMRVFGACPLAGRLVALDLPALQITVSVWLVRGRHATRLGPVFDLMAERLSAEMMPLHSAAE